MIIDKRAYLKKWFQDHRHPCLDCGKLCDYTAKRCQSCNGKKEWKTRPKTSTFFKKGKENCNWKGGKHKTPLGYIQINMPEHHRASTNGYVFEHILIWEQTHQKPLPKGWIIHHLNGIRDDNRPQNLVAMPNNKHYLLLQAKAKRIQELEGLLNHQNQLI